MQVSHMQDKITHAVMGSPETIELAVTDSADFMIMMSSTLYTNQKLAVVREVLCNAWDAHIDAGVTDTAIQITLSQDTLTIRDFGKGIPHYLIGAVYGTFGGSTKQNDGMQTGGFGLGCKSPFAYVEHFQVTSWNGGLKTIYTMSKSSAAVGGKPAINKIVSLPTTETGLEVSIKIQPNDRAHFQRLLYQIVRNGEIKATLNDDVMPVLPFSTAKHGFLVLSDNPNSGDAFHSLMVRYGNVVYPIPQHAELETKGIKSFLETLPGSPVLVLQAPPHSISVTPSREALSMKEQTLKTLQTLVGNFQKLLNRHLAVEVVKVFDAGLAEAVKLRHDHKVLTPKPEVPYVVVNGHNPRSNQHFNNPAELAKYQISARYPQLPNFRRMEIRKRVQAAAAMGAIDKALAHTFLVEFRKDKYHGRRTKNQWENYEQSSNWFQRRIVAPLAQALWDAGLPTDRLMAIGHGHDEGSYQRRVQKDSIYPALSAPRLRMSSYMLYLRRIVVLSHINDPIELLDSSNWPAGQQKYGFLNYRVSVTPKRIEEARAVFAQSGYTVIDLLEDPDALREKLANRAKAKEKKVGILRADAALDSQLNWWTPANTRLELGKARIESPEWVCKATARKRDGTWEQMVESWDAEVSTTFLRLFGKVGGFYTNVNQTKKMKAVSPEVYLIRKVTEYIMGSDNLKQFFYVDPKREDNFRFGGYSLQTEMEHLYRRVMYTPKLREHFGMDYTLTEMDRQMLTLWRWIAGKSEYSILVQVPQAKPVLRYVASLPFHPKRFALKQLLKDRGDMLELLDLDKIRSRLSADDPTVVAHVTKVLLTTLEG